MYEFKHEKELREKRRKLFLLLFNILLAINLIIEIKEFILGHTSGLRLIIIPLGWSIVLYYGIRRKSWAEWIIIIMVIVIIVFLLILLIITIIDWIV